MGIDGGGVGKESRCDALVARGGFRFTVIELDAIVCTARVDVPGCGADLRRRANRVRRCCGHDGLRDEKMGRGAAVAQGLGGHGEYEMGRKLGKPDV